MQLTISLMFAILVITTAKQLKPGPQTFTDHETPLSSKSNDKRYATQEYILYLTPSEIRALQAAKNDENPETGIQLKEQQQLSLQSYSEQPELNEWAKYNGLSSVEEPLAEKQETWKPVYENQGEDFDIHALYRDQKTSAEQAQIEEENAREEAGWKTYNPISTKSQEEAALHEQLQEHWNRILNHNREALKALSSAKENKNSQETKQIANPKYPWKPISNTEQENKSEIEREIEFALKHQEAFDKEAGRGGQRNNNQRTPILIHKEVRVTKHLPVAVVKKVHVPTPVLVPVPERYEVKVPHPYPVPSEVIKHIPVPIIRHA